jgi:hypothetical protein
LIDLTKKLADGVSGKEPKKTRKTTSKSTETVK